MAKRVTSPLAGPRFGGDDDSDVADSTAWPNTYLDRALQSLEMDGGLATADEERIAAMAESATTEIARLWEGERAVPPRVIWGRTLDEVRSLGAWALAFRGEHLPDARAFGEVPFGGAAPKSDAVAPWDVTASVTIPGTGFRIRGYIDRLDIAADGRRALVRDYKDRQRTKGQHRRRPR